MWQSTEPRLSFQQFQALLTETRTAIRVKHYSIRTEQTYLNWITAYLKFHNYKNPLSMAQSEANRYLAFLATQKHVAPATQNQACNGVIMLMKRFFNAPFQRPFGKRVSQKGEAVTRSDTVLRLTCFRMDTISVPSRNCLGIVT
jgi:hypothetical protein